MALALFSRNFIKLNHNVLRRATVCPMSLSANTMNLRKPFSMDKIPCIIRNISTTTPKLAASGASYIGLWTAERIVSVALIGVIPAAFIFPSQILDAAMAVSIMMHQYWGLEAICTDYLRPGVVGSFVSKLSHILLIIVTAATLSGLFYFIYNDIGIAKSIKKVWAIKGE